MRLSIGQELRQEQRQVMTQRMIQSMEILQLTLLQLEQRIDQELEQNPVLELVGDSTENEVEPASDSDFDDADEEEYTGMDSGILRKQEIEPEIRFEHTENDTNSTEEFSIANDFADSYSDTIDEAPVRSQNWLEEQEALRSDIFSNIPAPSETLQTHLERQLGWFDISEPLREMVLRIINNLDQCGYFSYDLVDFIGENASDADLALAEDALDLVQRLEPAGVGGKNLQDCLLLQVDPSSPYAAVLRVLIKSHLGSVSRNRVPDIVRETGYQADHIQAAIAELRHLNPRPGAGFGQNAAAAVIPDVVVEKIDTGKYFVRLEDGRQTQLRISKHYRDMLQKHELDKDSRDYVRKNIGSAQWLLNAIEQRRMTLLKVAQTIVDHQTAFFDNGEHALRPLKMEQIAEKIGIHITTVSRACDDKWIFSPQGIFPLRRFFISGLSAVDGNDEEIANDVVRLRLQEMIDNEDKNEPLSDEAIVQMLENEGVQVARRTIAKYRQKMDIPSSRRRKSWNV